MSANLCSEVTPTCDDYNMMIMSNGRFNQNTVHKRDSHKAHL